MSDTKSPQASNITTDLLLAASAIFGGSSNPKGNIHLLASATVAPRGYRPRFESQAAAKTPESLNLKKLTHKTIDAVTKDIEGFHFNKAVARIRELTNALEKIAADASKHTGDWNTAMGESLEATIHLLAPFLPHLAEELWALLGHTDLVATRSWPVADATLLAAAGRVYSPPVEVVEVPPAERLRLILVTLAALLASHTAEHLLLMGAWWVLGRAVLRGQADTGVLTAWALLLAGSVAGAVALALPTWSVVVVGVVGFVSFVVSDGKKCEAIGVIAAGHAVSPQRTVPPAPPPPPPPPTPPPPPPVPIVPIDLHRSTIYQPKHSKQLLGKPSSYTKLRT